MDSRKEAGHSADIAVIAASPSPTIVSDELDRLMGILRGFCPTEAVITFEYDGVLRVNIDVRDVADVARLETIMPSLCGGIFHDVQRGLAARHSFFHRISASIARQTTQVTKV